MPMLWSDAESEKEVRSDEVRRRKSGAMESGEESCR